MTEDNDPWAETPVVERESYQLRDPEEARDEWRTALIVATIILVLSAIASETFGATASTPTPTVEMHSN